jgi:hypothetical protein
LKKNKRRRRRRRKKKKTLARLAVSKNWLCTRAFSWLRTLSLLTYFNRYFCCTGREKGREGGKVSLFFTNCILRPIL